MSVGRAKQLLGSMAIAGAALVSCVSGSYAQQPQQTFSTVVGFGDSYADSGNVFTVTHTFNPVYPTGRFSGGTNFVDTMQFLLGVPQLNFALGGAQTGTNGAVPGLGFANEVQGFLAAGGRFAPTDVLAISIGGNDARAYYMGGGSLAGASGAASVSASQAIAGVGALIGAGARNVVFTVGDVSTLPEAATKANVAAGSAFSQSYNLQTQTALAAFAQAGVRVEYVDIAMIGNLIKANPAAYGITNTGTCPLTCLGNPTLQYQSLFYVDALHLTSHGFAILGQYIVNRLEAPLTFPSQGDLGMAATQGFVATLFGRLDLFNESSAIGGSGFLAYAPVKKGPLVEAPPPPPNPLSVYILANGGFGHHSSTPTANAYEFESVGGTIGAEYRIGSNAFLGAAFNYANPNARLASGAGTTSSDAYQFGLYGAWNGSHFFAQALATAGFQSYRNTRPGVVDTVRSRAEGANFAAGGKVGYLFDIGGARVGPIAGLTYAYSQINPFTESGDPVLILNVGRQRVEALVGSAGAQVRYPFLFGGRPINPFLNLTVEDDFRGNGRIIQFGALSAPLIVNTWNIPDGSHRIYGRVAAGFQANVYANVSVTATATRTLGRRGGDDFFGSGGVKIAF